MSPPRFLILTSLLSAAGWFAVDVMQRRERARHAREFAGRVR